MAGFRERVTGPVDLQAVPYPAVTVGVDLGEGPLVVDVTGRQQRGSVAVGLSPGGVGVHGRNIACLQVRMSPVVAYAVLGALREPGAMPVALDDLWGRDARRMEEQLREAVSWEDRFTIAETALVRRFDAGPTVDPEVAFTWRLMVANRGRVRVERLADEVGWSRKRLWSRFGSQIGLSPKRAAELIRFDHAAHRLAAGDQAAQVAAEGGYVDQSHLHREALAFAGVTPSAVAVAPWLAVDDVAWAHPTFGASRPNTSLQHASR
jgi:AraC-like DNA-binding protein